MRIGPATMAFLLGLCGSSSAGATAPEQALCAVTGSRLDRCAMVLPDGQVARLSPRRVQRLDARGSTKTVVWLAQTDGQVLILPGAARLPEDGVRIGLEPGDPEQLIADPSPRQSAGGSSANTSEWRYVPVRRFSVASPANSFVWGIVPKDFPAPEDHDDDDDLHLYLVNSQGKDHS